MAVLVDWVYLQLLPMPHLLLRLWGRKRNVTLSESLLPVGELDNLQLLETLSCSICM